MAILSDSQLASCSTIPPPQHFNPSASQLSNHHAAILHHHRRHHSATHYPIDIDEPLTASDGKALRDQRRPRSSMAMHVDDVGQDAFFAERTNTQSLDKGKGRAEDVDMDASGADALMQPPGRKLCVRHQRMADEGVNLQLQKTLDALPLSERDTVSKIWSSFGSSSHPRRALILQGLLTMCCQSQLSLLSEQLAQINRIDPFSLFPREVSLKVLGFLDAKALTRAAQVSNHWKDLADDNILWKNMCVQHIEKKCTKCGWGLPLLARRILMQQRGVDGGLSNPSSPTPSLDAGTCGMKRSASHLAMEGVPIPKRARSYSPSHGGVTTSTDSTSLPVRLPLISRQDAEIISSGPSSPNPVDPSTSLSCTSGTRDMIPRLTRPWKDVYSERLKIERNWRTGRYTAKVLKGHSDSVMCLQFNEKLSHPLFPVLITGSFDRTVRVWNMETGQVVKTLEGHTRAVRALQFDECKLVTASMDWTLRLWDWRTGRCRRTFDGHTAGVVCLAFDSNVLVSGSVDKTVKVWNFSTGDCFTLRGHQDWVNAVQLWDGGGWTGSSPSVDLTPCTSIADTTATATPATTLNPGKMLFSASDDGTIRLWDLSRRECVRLFLGHIQQVQSIQLAMVDEEETQDEEQSEEQPTASGSASRNLSPAPSPPDEQTQALSRSSSSSSLSASAIWAPSHTSNLPRKKKGSVPVLISGSLDNTVKMWDIDSGKVIRTLFGHIQGVWAVSSDKLRLVSGSHDKTIKIWNRDEGKCVTTLVGHRGAVTCTALGDDKIVSGSDDGDIRIWNFAASPSASLSTSVS